MAYFGRILFANMGGGGGQNYFQFLGSAMGIAVAEIAGIAAISVR